MKILFVVDVYEWSLHNISRGYAKYSKYKVDTLSRIDFNANLDVVKDYNIVVYMLWGDLGTLYGKVEETCLAHGTKVVVGLWTDSNPIYGSIPSCVKAFVYGDRKVYEEASNIPLISQYPKYCLLEAVDCGLFVPKPKPRGFTLGWAGNYYRANKRTYLLFRLNYPVKIPTPKEWPDFLRMLDERRGQQEMVDFYNSINAYVYVSTAEGGQSTTILEAMACGLPVVATNAGGEMSRLLPENWVVPVDPEDEVVRIMNNRLKELADDSALRSDVGESLRSLVEEKYSWKQRAKEYDTVFEEIWNKY